MATVTANGVGVGKRPSVHVIGHHPFVCFGEILFPPITIVYASSVIVIYTGLCLLPLVVVNLVRVVAVVNFDRVVVMVQEHGVTVDYQYSYH